VTITDPLLDLDEGIGQRFGSFEFELLDQSNSYLGRLTVDADSPPKVSNSINRTVKRVMSGLHLPPDVTADIDTMRHRVRPVYVQQNGQRHNLGVYLFADASRMWMLYDDGPFAPVGLGKELDGNMADQLATLNQGSRGINFYGPGHGVQAALEQQLEVSGVVQWELDPTDATFTQWTVWKPNEKRLTVINDLLRMAGYYSLWFDNDGVAQLREVPSLDAADLTINYRNSNTVDATSIVESDDQLETPNTYVVVNSAFTEAPVWGEWQVPASSPHSYDRRGFWVVKELDMQGVESNAAAAKAAKAYGQADYATYKWLSYRTAFDPRHDTFDVVGWFDGDRYREQSFQYTLQEGADMDHELRRVYSDDVADFLAEAA
jgi:hypothetical protein